MANIAVDAVVAVENRWFLSHLQRLVVKLRRLFAVFAGDTYSPTAP
jgi:hypothetical protein